ncbi:DUF4885 family protein [Selenomonas sp. AE3005]|uniref:DUF4885 family protein n=1 Tax=Selenomonas sp. AE3005 TaxID=1485543 RepID=UPI0025E27733|nr:DUF4885 family protein [Selenomonas sp. AE3005]
MLYNKVGHLDASGNYVYTKNSDRIANEKRQYLSTDSEYTVESSARKGKIIADNFHDEIVELQHSENPGAILYKRYDMTDLMQFNHVQTLWNFLNDDGSGSIGTGMLIEPILKGEPVMRCDMEEAYEKRFQRQIINKQLDNIFTAANIKIPENVSLDFTVTTDYQIHVTGDADAGLLQRVENVLNRTPGNGRALSEHIREMTYCSCMKGDEADKEALKTWAQDAHKIRYENGSLYDYSHYQYGDGQTQWLEEWEANLRKIGDNEEDFATPSWLNAATLKESAWPQMLLKKSRETLDKMVGNSFLSNWAAEMGNRNIDITHWNFRFDFSARRGGWCVVGHEGTPAASIMEKTLNQEDIRRKLLRNVIACMNPARLQHKVKAYFRPMTLREIEDVLIIAEKYANRHEELLPPKVLDRLYDAAEDMSKVIADNEVAVYKIEQQLYKRVEEGWDPCSDFDVSIEYRNGHIYDLGQEEQYGWGETEWIERVYCHKEA